MKDGSPCPKCNSHKKWEIDALKTTFLDRVGWVRSQAINLLVRIGVEEKLGGIVKQQTAPEHIGKMSAHVCASCGYTELWSSDFEGLRHSPDDGVRWIDNTPQQGGFR